MGNKQSIEDAFNPELNGFNQSMDPNRNGISNAFDPNKNGFINAFDPNKNGFINAFDPNRNGVGVAFENSFDPNKNPTMNNIKDFFVNDVKDFVLKPIDKIRDIINDGKNIIDNETETDTTDYTLYYLIGGSIVVVIGGIVIYKSIKK
jgi:hypothetical protein